jgi:hypothetical protein
MGWSGICRRLICWGGAWLCDAVVDVGGLGPKYSWFPCCNLAGCFHALRRKQLSFLPIGANPKSGSLQ